MNVTGQPQSSFTSRYACVLLTPSILAISPYEYSAARSCLALSRTSAGVAGSARRITPAPGSGFWDDPEAVPGLVSANARLSAADQKLGNAFSISLPSIPAAGATTQTARFLRAGPTAANAARAASRCSRN